MLPEETEKSAREIEGNVDVVVDSLPGERGEWADRGVTELAD